LLVVYVEMARASSQQAAVNFYARIAAKGATSGPYVKAREKVDITCANGHNFQIVPYALAQGNWCPKCSGRCPEQSRERLIEVINSRGGELLSEYISDGRKVLILCENSHVFDMRPGDIKREDSRWCPKCSSHCPIQAMNSFLEIVSAKGGIPLSPYINAKTKVSIRCSVEHVFEITPSDVKNSYWCSKCANNNPEQARDRLLIVIEKKEGKLLTEYENDKSNVWVRCKKSHVFDMRPGNIKSGQWCPQCAHSKLEEAICEYLRCRQIEFTTQVNLPGTRKTYDVGVPSLSLLIEGDGQQHFRDIPHFHGEDGFAKQKESDTVKDQYAYDNNLHLVRIPYSQVNNIESILDSVITTIKTTNMLFSVIGSSYYTEPDDFLGPWALIRTNSS
jgi:very-short-patch-repair endonuclease